MSLLCIAQWSLSHYVSCDAIAVTNSSCAKHCNLSSLKISSLLLLLAQLRLRKGMCGVDLIIQSRGRAVVAKGI